MGLRLMVPQELDMGLVRQGLMQELVMGLRLGIILLDPVMGIGPPLVLLSSPPDQLEPVLSYLPGHALQDMGHRWEGL